MISWQITDIEELNKINVTEDLEQIDDLKIKITKCFITLKDINVYSGLKKQELPYTPGKFAVGQITELLSESNYFQKGQKVYLTLNGNDEKEGFLKENSRVNNPWEDKWQNSLMQKENIPKETLLKLQKYFSVEDLYTVRESFFLNQDT